MIKAEAEGSPLDDERCEARGWENEVVRGRVSAA
jgi:hypothetical protein